MKNKYLKSKCGYDMQGENQNTEKSRITERVRDEMKRRRGNGRKIESIDFERKS